MRIFVWLVRAAIFFTLFAFALNNQQEAGIRWFFGQEWRAPMVFIVLAAFALGCAFGVFAMVPAWWRHRRVARKHAPVAVAPAEVTPTTMSPDSTLSLPHPPRDGL
ncbi:MAG: LapA family protein [Burkholderiaceae bacterium]